MNAAIRIYVTHLPSSGHSDAYFALAGALGGAVVAGILGIAGLTLQSRHENRRLHKQLEHERDEQDLGVLREILGDAAEALGRVRSAFIRLLRFIGDDPTGPLAARREDAMSQQRVAAAATRAALDRLRLQLQPDDELMKAYESVMETLDEIADLMTSRPDDYYDRIGALDPVLVARTDEFIRLARARVGPRPTPQPGAKRGRNWKLPPRFFGT